MSSPRLTAPSPPVSRLGDCWQIGDHFLLCGDALKPESYERLLGGKRAQMVFTDPPYNVRIAGNVSGLGQGAASRVRDGVRRDDPARIHEFPAARADQPRRIQHRTARSISYAWIGDISENWPMPPMTPTRNSKTSAFGRRAMPAWARYTGPPTSSFSSTKTGAPSTSTTSNSAASEEAERIFGNMPA